MIILHEPWIRSDKLLNEGEKLRDEGEKLWVKGNTLLSESRNLQEEGGELWAEGLKLRNEGLKLRAEGLKLWDEGYAIYRATVKDFFGEDILINWSTVVVKPKSKKRAVMPFGELFGYNNLT